MSNVEQNRPTEEERVHEAYSELGKEGVEARKEEPGKEEGFVEMGKKAEEKVEEKRGEEFYGEGREGGEAREARKEQMTEEE